MSGGFYNFSKWLEDAAKNAGIDGVTGFTIKYDNDVGPDDDGFWEWWDILSPSGETIAKCDKQDYAIMICAFLNEQNKK